MNVPLTPAGAAAAGFIPHGDSFLWQFAPIGLHVASDLLMALAYFAIPAGLAHFARRRPDLAFRPVIELFCVFIAAAGVVHLLAAVVVWYPAYWIEGLAKALAAIAAAMTAITLWRKMPRILALSNPRMLEHANTKLNFEVARRQEAEARLRESHAALERNVVERTRQLTETNARLEREIVEHRRTDQALRYNETLLRRLHDGLEEHIAERTAELTKTISELESFSYSISHDLRAPLRAINGYAAILRAEHASALAGEGQGLLGRIEDNAARMAQLIDGLLDFARLARAEIVRVDVDMTELAHAAAAEATTTTDSNAGAIEIVDLPAARGDAQMLRQVWVNLIANALKFSAPKPNPNIRVGGEQRGDETVYWVRDNGVGFDMAYAEKLFGVFHRLHRADEFPGVGVGLAIVRRIVVRHGGRVWAESAPGSGSTFYFSIPTGAPTARVTS